MLRHARCRLVRSVSFASRPSRAIRGHTQSVSKYPIVSSYNTTVFAGPIALALVGLGVASTAQLDSPTSPDESKIGEYTARLSKLSTLNQLFEAFASTKSESGELLMTPDDFLRACLSGKFYSGPTSASLSSPSFSAAEALPFVGNGDGCMGLQEFVFYLTLLQVPEQHFKVAFRTLDQDHNGVLDLNEFTRLLSRLAPPTPTPGGGGGDSAAAAATPPCRLVTHLFGPTATAAAAAPAAAAAAAAATGGSAAPAPTLALPAFCAFLRLLRRQLLVAEFELLLQQQQQQQQQQQHGSGSPTPTPSLCASSFALSLVASAPPHRIQQLVERARKLKKPLRVGVEEFVSVHGALGGHTPDIQAALQLQAASGGGVRQAELVRCVEAATGYRLRPELASVVFAMFDADGDGTLGLEEVVSALQARGVVGIPKSRASSGSGAGVGQAVGGAWSSFWRCVRDSSGPTKSG